MLIPYKYKHNQPKKKKENKASQCENTHIHKLQFQTCSAYNIYTLAYN